MRYRMMFMPLLLVSCPRAAHIDGYNNTGVPLVLVAGDRGIQLNPGERGKTKFLSNNFKVESSLGKWTYERRVPHHGENGDYYNGTLSAQINRDGSVYLLRCGDEFPVGFSYPQPVGYPLAPR
jgi:hypothetical protein